MAPSAADDFDLLPGFFKCCAAFGLVPRCRSFHALSCSSRLARNCFSPLFGLDLAFGFAASLPMFRLVFHRLIPRPAAVLFGKYGCYSEAPDEPIAGWQGEAQKFHRETGKKIHDG